MGQHKNLITLAGQARTGALFPTNYLQPFHCTDLCKAELAGSLEDHHPQPAESGNA